MQPLILEDDILFTLSQNPTQCQGLAVWVDLRNNAVEVRGIVDGRLRTFQEPGREARTPAVIAEFILRTVGDLATVRCNGAPTQIEEGVAVQESWQGDLCDTPRETLDPEQIYVVGQLRHAGFQHLALFARGEPQVYTVGFPPYPTDFQIHPKTGRLLFMADHRVRVFTPDRQTQIDTTEGRELAGRGGCVYPPTPLENDPDLLPSACPEMGVQAFWFRPDSGDLLYQCRSDSAPILRDENGGRLDLGSGRVVSVGYGDLFLLQETHRLRIQEGQWDPLAEVEYRFRGDLMVIRPIPDGFLIFELDERGFRAGKLYRLDTFGQMDELAPLPFWRDWRFQQRRERQVLKPLLDAQGNVYLIASKGNDLALLRLTPGQESPSVVWRDAAFPESMVTLKEAWLVSGALR